MKIYNVMQTKNPAYVLARPTRPIGILVHSTGASNNELRRYVDAPQVLGKNQYGNHWNSPKQNKSMHQFIGLDINREVAVAHTLPYNIACWGAGAGPKGSANRDPYAHIQFEVCEDNAPRSKLPPTKAQTEYYNAVWKLTEDYCVHLCEKFGFTADNITSHYEAHQAGLASNHGDPRNWMKIYGDSMDKFRARVAARLQEDEVTVPVPVPTEPEKKNYTIKVQLTAEENLRLAGNVPKNTIREYDFEDYVATSTAGEIGNPVIEAAKAQAIASRTFAWPYVLNNKPILDTSPSQSFRIARHKNKSYPRAQEAARLTAGLTVGYKGLTVPNLYYADMNGGTMLATAEKWGKIYMPWHQHKKDPWDYAVSKGKINGHQIGMSQTGAIYAAEKEGKTAEEILAFYYPETSIIPATQKLAAIPKAPAEVPVALPTLYLAKIETRKPAGLYLWVDPQKSRRAHSALVPKGATVNVLSEPNEGFVFARHNGREGYIDYQYVRKIVDVPAPNPPTEDLSVKKVKTRYGKGIGLWNETDKRRRLIKAPEGAIVKVIKNQTARWAYVEYKGVKGYADRNYLV